MTIEPDISRLIRLLAQAQDIARKRRMPMKLRHALVATIAIAFGIAEKERRIRR